MPSLNPNEKRIASIDVTEIDPRSGASGSQDGKGPVNADISRRIVQIHSEFYGRGPTKARTVLDEHMVITVLEDIFTRAERTLVEADKFEHVRTARLAFHDQIEPMLREAVEIATGRQVRSFLSQVSPEGIASEVFVLTKLDGANLDGAKLDGDRP